MSKRFLLIFSAFFALIGSTSAVAQTKGVDDGGHQWWQHAVFYEIYIRSFADGNNDGVGDLKGITSKMNYLHDLGVDAIWITPCFPSPQVDFGYDVSDYESGTPATTEANNQRHRAPRVRTERKAGTRQPVRCIAPSMTAISSPRAPQTSTSGYAANMKLPDAAHKKIPDYRIQDAPKHIHHWR